MTGECSNFGDLVAVGDATTGVGEAAIVGNTLGTLEQVGDLAAVGVVDGTLMGVES